MDKITDHILELRGLTKRYPGITALSAVDLTLEAGSVHALLGENGAGKSTLIKVLAGAVKADAGTLTLGGEPGFPRNPLEAHSRGISVVHQHTHLIPDLSLAENFALRQGYPKRAWGAIDWRRMGSLAEAAVASLRPGLNVWRDARTLTGVEKQLVELSFGLAGHARVLILDEPTAMLPHAETELLFEQVRKFVADGGAVLFVSHRLNEVFQLADQATVLRDGKLVWSQPVAALTHDDLIRGMVGRGVVFERDATLVPEKDTAFSIEDLTDSADAFRSINLTVRRGEIYGLYGLVGAGQSELCAALLGLRPTANGKIDVAGRGNLDGLAPRKRVRQGLAYVPAERLERGMFRQMTVGENMSITSLARRTWFGFVRAGSEIADNLKYIRDLQIKTLGPDQNALQLSGGNQQKVLLGRWLQTRPDVLILEEPTQGVDVGAKAEIHRLIRELARSGVAVLLVTSELPELLALSHRVGTIREGKLSGELDGATATEESVLARALPDHESKRAAGAESASAAAPGKPILRRVLGSLVEKRELGLACFMLVLATIACFYAPAFLTVSNIRQIVLSQAILLIGALGISMIIIAGEIDISIGAMLGLCAMLAGKLDLGGASTALVYLVPVAAGLALGAWNGALTVWGRVHSIVITLGMMFILRGVLIQSMESQLNNFNPRLTALASHSFGGKNVSEGLPLILLLAGGVAAAVFVFLRSTVSGRRLFALGGDRPSAALLGVKSSVCIPLVFAISGTLIGFAGLLTSARFGQIQSIVGEGFELKAIAAAVIGGTHIMGGRGSVVGVILGALFLGMVSNLLIMLHVSEYWDNAIIGGMILLAVVMDAAVSRIREGRHA